LLKRSTWDYRRHPKTIAVNLRLSPIGWDYRHFPEAIRVNLRLSVSPSRSAEVKPKFSREQRPGSAEFSNPRPHKKTKRSRQSESRPLPVKRLYKRCASWQELSQFPELTKATSRLQDPPLPRRRSHVLEHPTLAEHSRGSWSDTRSKHRFTSTF